MPKRIPTRDMIVGGTHREAGKPTELTERQEKDLDEMNALVKEGEDKPAEKTADKEKKS